MKSLQVKSQHSAFLKMLIKLIGDELFYRDGERFGSSESGISVSSALYMGGDNSVTYHVERDGSVVPDTHTERFKHSIVNGNIIEEYLPTKEFLTFCRNADKFTGQRAKHNLDSVAMGKRCVSTNGHVAYIYDEQVFSQEVGLDAEFVRFIGNPWISFQTMSVVDDGGMYVASSGYILVGEEHCYFDISQKLKDHDYPDVDSVMSKFLGEGVKYSFDASEVFDIVRSTKVKLADKEKYAIRMRSDGSAVFITPYSYKFDRGGRTVEPMQDDVELLGIDAPDNIPEFDLAIDTVYMKQLNIESSTDGPVLINVLNFSQQYMGNTNPILVDYGNQLVALAIGKNMTDYV